jgi:hypothetical protein
MFTPTVTLSSQNNTENVKTVSRPNVDLLTAELLVHILNNTRSMADNKSDILTL